MSCERPILIRNPRYSDTQSREFWSEYYYKFFDVKKFPDEYIEVPCGTCYSCRKTYLNGWRLRLNYEYSRYPNSIFVTFTFDDENLKRFTYAPNRAVRLFLDRARKHFGKQLRHFIIGEFGEKTGRFHYHGILFNIPDSLNADTLSKLWKYGFIYIGYCNKKTINYILKYITKEDKSPAKKKIPRIIASKGIGENFVSEHCNDPMVTELKPYISLSNGAKIVLPRYYTDKLYSVEDKIIMSILRADAPFARYIDGKVYNNPYQYKKALLEKLHNNIALGLTPILDKPKPKVSKLSPIRMSDIREISPFDKYDFYTIKEKAIINSCFDINETPF